MSNQPENRKRPRPVFPPGHVPTGKVTYMAEADPDLNNNFIEETQQNLDRQGYIQRVSKAVFAVLDFLHGKNADGKKYPKRWLAERLGVSEQAVGQMLKTGRAIEGETLHKLSEVIGVDLFGVMAEKSIHQTDKADKIDTFLKAIASVKYHRKNILIQEELFSWFQASTICTPVVHGRVKKISGSSFSNLYCENEFFKNELF